eukprot:s1827_g2.t1
MEQPQGSAQLPRVASESSVQPRHRRGFRRHRLEIMADKTKQVSGELSGNAAASSSARLYFDEFNCAHLEINEMASQESLEAAVDILHNMQRIRKNVKAVVMHLEGVSAPAQFHSYALASGTFLVGLRAISVPIILAAWGRISGPSWNLALACDYRIAALDADFVLPIISPPECLGELVGQAVAAQLSISSGTLDSQGLQELGILNQVRPSKDETCRAATELGKRIAGFPGIACRQTMSLLSVPPVRYISVGASKLPDPDLFA